MPKIYLFIDNKEEGPFTVDDVKKSLVEGVIPADLPALIDGWEDWEEVSQLLSMLEDSQPKKTTWNLTLN